MNTFFGDSNMLQRKPGCSGPLTGEEVVWMIRQGERKFIPLKERAHHRMLQLHERFDLFALAGRCRKKRSWTPEEWRELRRLMRHGIRIAVIAKDIGYQEFFKNLYDTATIHLRDNGQLL